MTAWQWLELLIQTLHPVAQLLLLLFLTDVAVMTLQTTRALSA
jgi:hypothetical protein